MKEYGMKNNWEVDNVTDEKDMCRFHNICNSVKYDPRYKCMTSKKGLRKVCDEYKQIARMLGAIRDSGVGI
jgi:hypothetical protein